MFKENRGGSRSGAGRHPSNNKPVLFRLNPNQETLTRHYVKILKSKTDEETEIMVRNIGKQP